jgi:uncharacterized protein (DUF58 family)
VSRGGRLAIGLGAGALLSGWLFGSVALFPVAAGLIAAGLFALGWRRLVSVGVRVEYEAPATIDEGQPLHVSVRLRHARVLAGRCRLTVTVGVLGEHEIAIARGRGALDLGPVPRGVYPLGPTAVELEDPFGLECVSTSVEQGERVRVRPRVIEVDRLFTGASAGLLGADGRRRRSSGGLEPAGIRDYQEGEPLRSVHWPSTARRGVLMVRELDDPSRDDVVVVLDGDRAGAVGQPGRSSFDDAVRIAAALVRATIRSGKRARLVVHGASTASYRAGGAPSEWEALLDGLAAAEADAATPVGVLLDDRAGVVRGVDGAIVVTSRPSPAIVRSLSRVRRGGLVVVDSATYADGRRSGADPTVLRAAASGVAVAVVRRGDDLALRLSGRPAEKIGA